MYITCALSSLPLSLSLVCLSATWSDFHSLPSLFALLDYRNYKNEKEMVHTRCDRLSNALAASCLSD